MDRPNPFQKEIEICEDLINNCHRMRVIAGLAEAREQTLEDLEKKLINEMAIQDLDKRVEEGKLERFKTKQEREAEALESMGGRKKKGGKKPKAA